MKRTGAKLISVLLVLGMASSLGAIAVSAEDVVKLPKMGIDAPPPENYDAIMRAQFEALAEGDTIQGYQLFIARNPDDPLVELALDRIDWLRTNCTDALPPWR